MAIDSRAPAISSGVGNVRLGADMTTGHGCFPPTRPTLGSITSFTDQIAQVRVGDTFAPHCCGGCHTPTAMGGSLSAYADQIMTHRMLDPLSCGDSSATGSISTFTGN